MVNVQTCLTRGPRRPCIAHLIQVSTGLSFQEKKFKIDFQDGCHVGFPIRRILATFDTSNEVSSQLAFWFRIKKFKIDFQQAARATIVDFR